MATDYFPRLAATHSNNEMNAAVKGQAEISMLLFAPIVVAFLVFLKPIIVLLYSNKFLPIEGMMYAAMSATIIKALAWSLSYTILAKGKPSYFFLNELISMLYSVPIKLLAYKYWGLTGFGYAIVFTYILYLIQLIIVTKKLFGTTVGKTEWTICAVSCLCICMALFAKVLCPVLIGYIVGSVLLIGTAIYSYVELNKRMDITDIVKKKVISKKQTTI
jgi:PST family polysaccharide transporter